MRQQERDLTERDLKARQVAENLVKWFEGKKFPTEPFYIRPGEKVLNAQKMFDVACGSALHAMPYSQLFIASFQQLKDFKKHIENELINENNSR